MTVLAAIEDALVNMAEAQPQGGTESTEELQSRLQTQLNSLNQEEEKDYNNLLDSPIPKILEPHIERWWLEKDVITHLKDLEMESFFKDPIFCHTAILPAEIRFKGLLTENSTHTTDSIYDQTYEKAVMLNDIQSLENPGRRDDSEPVAYVDPRPEKAEQFVLGGLDGEYQDCEEHLNLDKKDFFYISSRSDWRTLTLPNDAEKEYYTEYDAKNQKGYILACLAKCDWGKCPAGDIQPYFGYLRPEPRKGQQGLSEAEIKAMGKIEMVINGEKVTEASNMHSCYALKNKKGHVWQPNENGQYEIRGRISGTNDYSYLRFSSFVFL